MTKKDFEEQYYNKDFTEFLDRIYGEKTYLEFSLFMLGKMHLAFLEGRRQGYNSGYDDGYNSGVEMAQLGLE